jgi:hypothetical protein
METTILSTTELAKHFGCSNATIDHWRRHKGLPGVLKNICGKKCHMFNLADVERWLIKTDTLISRRMQHRVFNKPETVTRKKTNKVWLEANEIAKLLDVQEKSVRDWAGDPYPPEYRFENGKRRIYYKLQLTLSWETENEKDI